MHAREVDSLPSGEDWLYELLWRGESVRVVKRDHGVNVLSRDGRDLTNRFPRIAAAVARLRSSNVIIDGEILHLDGYSDDAICFLTQAADDLSTSRLAFLACDLICDDGRDVRQLSLLCRLLLAAAVQATPVFVSPLIHDSAGAALELAARLGLRGVLAKRAGSPYRPNSLNQDWVKVVLPARAEAGPGHRTGNKRGSNTASPPLGVS
jgi:bifunctional non-homologous end joining protein LigD